MFDYNPFTGKLDLIGLTKGSADSTYLKLDQTTPQTTVGTFTFPRVLVGDAVDDLTSILQSGQGPVHIQKSADGTPYAYDGYSALQVDSYGSFRGSLQLKSDTKFAGYGPSFDFNATESGGNNWRMVSTGNDDGIGPGWYNFYQDPYYSDPPLSFSPNRNVLVGPTDLGDTGEKLQVYGNAVVKNSYGGFYFSPDYDQDSTNKVITEGQFTSADGSTDDGLGQFSFRNMITGEYAGFSLTGSEWFDPNNQGMMQIFTSAVNGITFQPRATYSNVTFDLGISGGNAKIKDGNLEVYNQNTGVSALNMLAASDAGSAQINLSDDGNNGRGVQMAWYDGQYGEYKFDFSVFGWLGGTQSMAFIPDYNDRTQDHMFITGNPIELNPNGAGVVRVGKVTPKSTTTIFNKPISFQVGWDDDYDTGEAEAVAIGGMEWNSGNNNTIMYMVQADNGMGASYGSILSFYSNAENVDSATGLPASTISLAFDGGYYWNVMWSKARMSGNTDDDPTPNWALYNATGGAVFDAQNLGGEVLIGTTLSESKKLLVKGGDAAIYYDDGTYGSEMITNPNIDTGSGWTGGTGWDASNAYLFTCTAPATLPVAGNTYTHNSSTYTFRYANTAKTLLVFQRTSGTNEPLASGTLVRTSGSGTTPITFSAVTEGATHGAAGTGTFTQALATMAQPIQIGSAYKVSIDTKNLTAGSYTVTMGGVTLGTVSGNGVISFTFKAATQDPIVLTPVTTARFFIDSISVKRLTGGDLYVGGDINAGSYHKDGSWMNIYGDVNIGDPVAAGAYRVNVKGDSGNPGILNLETLDSSSIYVRLKDDVSESYFGTRDGQGFFQTDNSIGAFRIENYGGGLGQIQAAYEEIWADGNNPFGSPYLGLTVYGGDGPSGASPDVIANMWIDNASNAFVGITAGMENYAGFYLGNIEDAHAGEVSFDNAGDILGFKTHGNWAMGAFGASNNVFIGDPTGGDHGENFQVFGTAAFGDITNGNYSEFEADGTYKANGAATTFKDLQFGISTGKVGAANVPSWSSFIGNLYEYSFAVNDYMDLGSQEIPHDYKEGSDLELHVHFSNNGTNVDARGVKWEIEYTIANKDATSPYTEVFPSTTVVSAETTLQAGITDRSNIYSHIAVITGTNIKIGAQLKMRLRRIASTGTAPTSNPFALQVGVHYESDALGSRSELGK